MSTPSAPLPPIGTAIELVIDGEAVPARCEGGAGRELDVVVRDRIATPATVVELRWRGLRGVSTARGKLLRVEAVSGRTVTRWRVQLDGPIQVVQRRRVARAMGVGPVAVTRLRTRLATVVNGVLLDISEEALRARVPGGTLEAGEPVAVHIGLATEVLELRGEVLRVGRAGDGDDLAVIVHSADDAASTRIRRFVYLQQVRLRRAGLI